MAGTHASDAHHPAPRGFRLKNQASQRALAMWPRLDRRALARCAGDPKRIARLVAQRSTLPPEVIEQILVDARELDRELWFG